MDRQAVERAKLLTKRSVGAVRGLARFLTGKELGIDDWSALLDLHCMTNGRSTEMMTSAMRVVRPPKMKIAPFQSMLGSFTVDDVDKIAEGIRRDGYFTFENRIPLDVCDGILEAASR